MIGPRQKRGKTVLTYDQNMVFKVKRQEREESSQDSY
jgi:hypothetical protein